MPNPLQDALAKTAAIGASSPPVVIGEKLASLGGKVRDTVSSATSRMRTPRPARRTTDIRLPAGSRSPRGRR